MRVEIAELFRVARVEGVLRRAADGKGDADDVLAIMRAGIKGVGNPYAGSRGREAQREAFEGWRQGMLRLFSEAE